MACRLCTIEKAPDTRLQQRFALKEYSPCIWNVWSSSASLFSVSRFATPLKEVQSSSLPPWDNGRVRLSKLDPMRGLTMEFPCQSRIPSCQTKIPWEIWKRHSVALYPNTFSIEYSIHFETRVYNGRQFVAGLLRPVWHNGRLPVRLGWTMVLFFLILNGCW